MSETAVAAPQAAVEDGEDLHLQILGRTLEHLGVQMYKQRPTAIAELVANAWDAGATEVRITVPAEEDYDCATSKIVIADDGSGMSRREVQDHYLVIGRNRRSDKQPEPAQRPVMGRKGIGKLAGFGIAEAMFIKTWNGGMVTAFKLDINELKTSDNKSKNAPIHAVTSEVVGSDAGKHGTRITLRTLKHPTPLGIDSLHMSLARRFSRTIRDQMKIYINGAELRPPEMEYRFEGIWQDGLLEGGDAVKYRYSCAAAPIHQPEMRGFTIYARGKTVQAPPFFFNIENQASGQHGTRYLVGEIEADFIDVGTDDGSDLVSTDRQEVDWDHPRLQEFLEWGKAMARVAIKECATKTGEAVKDWLLEQEDVTKRIALLDPASQRQISTFFVTLGLGVADPEDKVRLVKLSDALLKAYEFQQFHDVVTTLESVGDDPEKLEQLLHYLGEWKVLESRALLEIIQGRLEIIARFEHLVWNNAPETPSKYVGMGNLHDLLAAYPWLINPEWQVYAEELLVSKQLTTWSYEDVTAEDARLRMDFFALSNDDNYIIIEIKRAGYPVSFEEVQRLEKYRNRLRKGMPNIRMVLIYGDTIELSPEDVETWNRAPDRELIPWASLIARAKKHYRHYEAVLKAQILDPNFTKHARELNVTRGIIAQNAVYRGVDQRREGLGPQYIEEDAPKT